VPIQAHDQVASGPTFPFWTNGGTVTIVWNAAGINKIT
jgi:hypothetical protein